MSDFIKPYNNDPFVGNLATPITSSSFTKNLLSIFPIYRTGVSPLLRGLEIGLAHGYFLLGPFYKLGPLRNSDVALLSGFLSSIGLIFIMTACLAIYGVVSFEETELSDPLKTGKGWRQFTSGWVLGAFGGSTFAYIILVNLGTVQSLLIK
nr:photosystem I subunit XI [Cryptomonas borealis]